MVVDTFLQSNSVSLEALLAGTEDFLATAGDLKGDLKATIKDIKDPRVIYPEVSESTSSFSVLPPLPLPLLPLN